MAKWEYTIVKTDSELGDTLRTLGDEGWELVSVAIKREHVPRQYFGDEEKDIDYQIAYLKRELASAQAGAPTAS